MNSWCHWMSHHKEQEYIWFRGGDLKDFFYELERVGMPFGTPSWSNWLSLIIRNKNLYGLGVGI